MSKTKVTILGCTGMLGSIVLDYFSGDDNFDVSAVLRKSDRRIELEKLYPGVKFEILDAEEGVAAIKDVIKDSDWVINAIGIIKPYIHDDIPNEVERAIRVNSLFPELLSQAANESNIRIIQIATDCVYSGEKGRYVEADIHDALDVYGKTKSLGETYQNNVQHLRCSIIGPEVEGHVSLLDWFLGQSREQEVNGFTNHQWNGVTTLHFAKLCKGIIAEGISTGHLQHVVPGNIITKANLLKAFGKEFSRSDIKVNDTEAPKVIDRTLDTSDEEMNKKLWKAAGYDSPPTVEDMVKELSEYVKSSKVYKK